jgi:hypothetical protein
MRAKWIAWYALGALACTALACTSAVDGDEEDASFGGSFAKADGRYTECQLRAVLAFVNQSTTTRDVLAELLSQYSSGRKASENIIAHRNGPDGQHGTGDDDIFDDLDELDAVSYVGPATLDLLVESIKDECEQDLSTRPFIDSTTFAGSTGGGWTRDSTELEATFAVSGVRGAKLREILLTRDRDGDSVFDDVAENDILAAFTYGYPIDEIPWDSDAVGAREALKHIALTIESGRFDPHRRTGERRISLGTDIMDDAYFDTPSFELLNRQFVLRGRARWDDPTTIRRLLIAAKSGSAVDPDGIKSAAKVDVRNDGASAEDLANLDLDVMRGMVAWNGSDVAIEPVRVIYDALGEANALPDIGGHEQVLLLDPLVYLRSIRSRLHFNEASITSVQNVHAVGQTRMELWITRSNDLVSSGSVTGAEADVLETLVREFGARTDGSLLLERVNAALSGAGHATMSSVDLATARRFGGVSSLEEVEQHRIVAEQIDLAYHEAAEILDEADRILTGASDDDNDVFADWFVDWQRSFDPALGRKTMIEPYLDRFDAMAGGADFDAQLAAFNQFAADERDDGDDDYEDFVEMDRAAFTAMRPYLALELVKIHQRQLDTAGVLANALYFDEARRFFVPRSSRATGNFLIDTTDYTDMVTHAEWHALTDDERRPDRDLPGARVFHSTLVNEVQIELGSETAYVERIRELRDELDSGSGNAETEAMLEGARFVFNAYQQALVTLAELKGDRVRRALRRGGEPDAQWGPAERSKGETALLMLADL